MHPTDRAGDPQTVLAPGMAVPAKFDLQVAMAKTASGNCTRLPLQAPLSELTTVVLIKFCSTNGGIDLRVLARNLPACIVIYAKAWIAQAKTAEEASIIDPEFCCDWK
jgi:hypothetical protein